MAGKMNKKIVLENGTEFYGFGFGAQDVERVCEMVFDTSMAGYQEIVSDPSYTGEAIVMTYPLIGNYGITDEDFESKTPTIGALIVREYNDFPSNFRYTKTLSEYLDENHIPGIYGMDTREITRTIRDGGSCKIMIANAETPTEKAVETIKNTVLPTDLVSIASCKKKWYARTANAKLSVVAIDCGIRLSLVRTLNEMGCNVTVLPYNTTVDDVKAYAPDGIIISQGPGDPANVTGVIELIKTLRGKYPIFGVGLGCQLIALAYGAKTNKMKFGHHGCNHPIKDIATGNIETCTQNHSYVIDEQSLCGTGLEVTHIDIIDKAVEGIKCEKDNVIAVQFEPTTMSGPNKRANLYEQFIALMKEGK